MRWSRCSQRASPERAPRPASTRGRICAHTRNACGVPRRSCWPSDAPSANDRSQPGRRDAPTPQLLRWCATLAGRGRADGSRPSRTAEATASRARPRAPALRSQAIRSGTRERRRGQASACLGATGMCARPRASHWSLLRRAPAVRVPSRRGGSPGGSLRLARVPSSPRGSASSPRGPLRSSLAASGPILRARTAYARLPTGAALEGWSGGWRWCGWYARLASGSRSAGGTRAEGCGLARAACGVGSLPGRGGAPGVVVAGGDGPEATTRDWIRPAASSDRVRRARFSHLPIGSLLTCPKALPACAPSGRLLRFAPGERLTGCPGHPKGVGAPPRVLCWCLPTRNPRTVERASRGCPRRLEVSMALVMLGEASNEVGDDLVCRPHLRRDVADPVPRLTSVRALREVHPIVSVRLRAGEGKGRSALVVLPYVPSSHAAIVADLLGPSTGQF